MLGESIMLRAEASDPDNDGLTYMWSSSAGNIIPNGNEATFPAINPGHSLITVRVTDARGCSAEDSCEVQTREPQRQLVKVPCVSGGFPRNLDRLNNVDKACLDNMALRLKQDPRSRLIIVGHADSGEQAPFVIAQKRAEAVRNYLVREQNIEESRISIESAAAERPADRGTDLASRARNRRVELVFVPVQ